VFIEIFLQKIVFLLGYSFVNLEKGGKYGDMEVIETKDLGLDFRLLILWKFLLCTIMVGWYR